MVPEDHHASEWGPFVAALRLGFEKQEEEAIRQLRALLQETSDYEDRGWILLYEARFLGHLLRVAEARKRLAEVSRIWKRTPQHDVRIAVGEAVLYEAEGNPSRALDELDRIFEKYAGQWTLPDMDDPYEEIQANRGRMLVGQDRCKEALPLLEETLHFERGKPGEFYFNLGYSYFMTEEWEKSERWLKEALTEELHPAFSSAIHYYLGRLEYRKAAFARAIKEFEVAEKSAVEAGTSRKVIYGALAKAYKHLGQEEDATRYAELARSSQ